MRDIRVTQRELSNKLARVARWERQHSISNDNYSVDLVDEASWDAEEVDLD